MNTLIPDSCFKRAQLAFLRLGLGLLLAGYGMASHAAQPMSDSFYTGVDLITIPLAHSVSENFRVNERGTNYTAPDRFRLGGMSALPKYINIKNIASWVLSVRWHMSEENYHTSFSPELQIDNNGSQYLIKPRVHSITFIWHKALN